MLLPRNMSKGENDRIKVEESGRRRWNETRNATKIRIAAKDATEHEIPIAEL